MKLSKLPVGWLDLLRLRSNGRAPQEASEVVATIVDATDMYGADLLDNSNLAASAGTLPLSIVDTIESSPIRMLALGARLTLGAAAGTSCVITVGLRKNAAAFIVPIASMEIVEPVAGQDYFVGVPTPGIVLPQGWQYLAVADGDAAGADHVLSVQALFQNLTSS